MRLTRDIRRHVKADFWEGFNAAVVGTGRRRFGNRSKFFDMGWRVGKAKRDEAKDAVAQLMGDLELAVWWQEQKTKAVGE